MANVELCKFYMGQQGNFNKIPEVVYTDIIKTLDAHFNYNWTWEIADEKLVMDNSAICTTVTVYIPGRVVTGRSLCKIKDYHENHLHAILDAVSFMIDMRLVQPVPQNNTVNNNSQQMTPDQIMAAVNQQQPMVNTKEQFYNYKDKQGMPADGVPFDQMTDNCHQELQQEMTGQPQQAMPPQQNPTSQPQQNMDNQSADYDAPQAKYKGFSQHQIDRLNQFKKDMDIMNDTMFGKWVNTWDKRYTAKSDITPQNVESFLAFVENMGKSLC